MIDRRASGWKYQVMFGSEALPWKAKVGSRGWVWGLRTQYSFAEKSIRMKQMSRKKACRQGGEMSQSNFYVIWAYTEF